MICIITLTYGNKTPNQSCRVEAAIAVASNLTITATVSWTTSKGINTGNLTSVINKGSSVGSSINMSNVIKDGSHWAITDNRNIYLARVNPNLDDTYVYETRIINEGD